MTATDEHALAAAVEARLPFAASLLDAVRAVSNDSVGVTRPPWSEIDRAAAEILAEAARGLDLAVRYDPAGNLMCTLPGRDRAAKGPTLPDAAPDPGSIACVRRSAGSSTRAVVGSVDARLESGHPVAEPKSGTYSRIGTWVSWRGPTDVAEGDER